MLFVEVIIKSKTRMTDMLYTYSVPSNLKEDVQRGKRVVVGFGKSNKRTIGVIVNVKKDLVLDFKVKEIEDVIDSYPILSDVEIDLAKFMVDRYLSDFSSAISTVLPPGDLNNIEEYYESFEGGDELLDYLKEKKSFREIEEKFNGKYRRIDLQRLIDEEKIRSEYELYSNARPKYEIFYGINESFNKDELSKAPKQLVVFNYLEENISVERKELMEKTSSSSYIINQLLEKDAIIAFKKRIYRDVLPPIKEYGKVKLNDNQQEVYDEIVNSNEQMFLIHGVTASGKTEIYLQLVEKVLDEGKQAIILVPEISLTPQTIERFQGRFKKQIAVLHSKLNISERFDQWKLIKNGEVDIAIGARSALFAPFDNLGIIVIDEEHELSYISETNPKYSSNEVAYFRAKRGNFKVVLGSATPSIETMKSCKNGNIKLLKLKDRVNNLAMPNISVTDMREEMKVKNYSMFSRELKEKIDEALSLNKQTILFLNKRGHTSFVFCRNCGNVVTCDACDVAMTYHLHQDRLVCHYCGRTKAKPIRCEACGSTKIKEFGAGTEMLELETQKLFPNAKIGRMDRDTVTSKNAYDKIYEDMKNHKFDILIGTQMIAKGFDFKDVTVVGIIFADLSLNISDYRANERTYQLITQVSGRAGRGENPGNVIIQTYKPNNFAIQSTVNQDFDKFYDQEIVIRERFNYPPFVKILLIRTSDTDKDKLIKESKKIAEYVSNNFEYFEMKGPMASVIERIDKRYRFNIIIKSQTRDEVRDIGRKVLDNFKNSGNFRVDVIIDPISIY